jgi:hypothetical protein
MSLTYPLEIESCAAADSTSSFAYEFGFADSNMAQTSVIACASLESHPAAQSRCGSFAPPPPTAAA